MQRLLLIFVLALSGTAAWAQDAEDASADEAAAEETQSDTGAGTPADGVTDSEVEELLGLDEDYRDAEDEFDPTEEVRFEQNILFPTDI
jgi:hypothetical protein